MGPWMIRLEGMFLLSADIFSGTKGQPIHLNSAWGQITENSPDGGNSKIKTQNRKARYDEGRPEI
jgi:hypothetical protein